MRVGESRVGAAVYSEACGLCLGPRSSVELAPSPFPSGIPVVLTGDSAPSCRARFPFPSYPVFRLSHAPVVSSNWLLTVSSANCLPLPLLSQGLGQKEHWINIGGPSARETPELYSTVQESQGKRPRAQDLPS